MPSRDRASSAICSATREATPTYFSSSSGEIESTAPNRVEAVAGVVWWQFEGDVDVDAGEIPDGVGIFNAVEPAKHHLARIGLRGIDAKDIGFNEVHHGRPLVIGWLRLLSGGMMPARTFFTTFAQAETSSAASSPPSRSSRPSRAIPPSSAPSQWHPPHDSRSKLAASSAAEGVAISPTVSKTMVATRPTARCALTARIGAISIRFLRVEFTLPSPTAGSHVGEVSSASFALLL